MTDIDAPGAILARPEWLAHRYDFAADAVHFVEVPRDERRAAVFLTDEYLGTARARAVVPVTALGAAIRPSAPIHFIFHSAFCCSSLMANALDLPGVAAPLKEPVILNDISGWRRRGGDPQRAARALGQALDLLARPTLAGEAVVIKPSNVVNAWMAAMMAARPEALALLMHAPLPVFLGSIARKGMWGRHWVRDLLVKLLRDGAVDVGLSSADDYLALTDLQAAAVGWLAQHRLFARLAERFGDRVRIVDSETLLARQDKAVAATLALFGLTLDDNATRRVAAGAAFSSHAKTGAPFSAADRAAERDDLESAHADEIGKVTIWAEAVARAAGIDLTPGPRLLP